ncbi:hypothetical protein B0H16DRAFT_1480364 [Mycena metata]|uniref:Uncharacterized protein n=1 Tax=Mycena metata TaxID=1033252 RepID=A0AAD7H3D4_9AGAR|nr:hypothetical protein B0H16DRAFT_1480364 [Mycena metata]
MCWRGSDSWELWARNAAADDGDGTEGGGTSPMGYTGCRRVRYGRLRADGTAGALRRSGGYMPRRPWVTTGTAYTANANRGRSRGVIQHRGCTTGAKRWRYGASRATPRVAASRRMVGLRTNPYTTRTHTLPRRGCSAESGAGVSTGHAAGCAVAPPISAPALYAAEAVCRWVGLGGVVGVRDSPGARKTGLHGSHVRPPPPSSSLDHTGSRSAWA